MLPKDIAAKTPNKKIAIGTKSSIGITHPPILFQTNEKPLITVTMINQLQRYIKYKSSRIRVALQSYFFPLRL